MNLLDSKLKRILPTEEKHRKCATEMMFLNLRREDAKARIMKHVGRFDDGLTITVKY